MGKLIPCSNCGKMIEQKGVRTMCIKCTNLWNKIQAEKRRATPEYKEYYKEYTKNHKRKGRLI